MKLVIPCAGESSRMYYVPKHLIKIRNKPLIAYVIDTWRDVVDSLVFVLRPNQSYMWELLPENSVVVFQSDPKGLADAILRAESCVSGRFVVNLGDCVFRGEFEETNCELGIGVWETDDLDEINKSYLVGVSPATGLVETVIEKPNTTIPHGNCGMGTYFLDDRVFDYIRRTEIAPSGGDFTSILQKMIDEGEEIKPIWFKGKYVNVGSPEDIRKAEETLQ